jgi:hypothetical protein
MSKIEIDSICIGGEVKSPGYYVISEQEDERTSTRSMFPITNIRIGEYITIAAIPYDVLEEYLKDIISNWNQKQKK